jgi:Tfp pilus tip-associated adhesin PilY1
MTKHDQKWLARTFACGVTALTATTLCADAVVEPRTQPIWWVAPLELSAYDLRINAGASAYQAWHENVSWSGDLREWLIDASGRISPGGWSAQQRYSEMETKAPADAPYWQQREIFTRNAGGVQIPFRWEQLSATQQAALTHNPVDPDAPYDGRAIVRFVRGERSNELPAGGYRFRSHALGDMLHSTPLYVGAPADATISDPSYAAYSAANSARRGRVYVGANDGMLHAFDAADGALLYSYIPSMLIPRLNRLAQPAYSHRSYVDGGLSSSDVKVGTAWKTLLAGALGAGGKGLFLLDVSDSEAHHATIVWELAGDANDDIGHIHDAPLLTRLPGGGDAVAVSGNGYLSAGGQAKLLLLSLQSPPAVTAIAAGSGNRGLSAPAVVASSGIAYAGDLNGNLWKFDLTSLEPPQAPLFSAGAAHPITGRPQVASHPDGGFMIYFSSGSLLSAADGAQMLPQRVFAIRDKTPRQPASEHGRVTESDLQQSVLREVALDDVDGEAVLVRLAETSGTQAAGWSASFPPANSGERGVGRAVLHAGRLQFISAWAAAARDDVNHAFNELSWLDGGAPLDVLSDYDNSGALDDGDIYQDGAAAAYPLGERLTAYDLYSGPVHAGIANGRNGVYLNRISYSYNTNCDAPAGRGGMPCFFPGFSAEIGDLVAGLDAEGCISSVYAQQHVTAVSLAETPACRAITQAIDAAADDFDLDKFLFFYEGYRHLQGDPQDGAHAAEEDATPTAAPLEMVPHLDRQYSEGRQSWVDLEQQP